MYLIISLLSALVLLTLIFKIKTSQSFNLFDHWLHQKLIRKRNGLIWKVIAFLYDPKLVVVWDIFLAYFLIHADHYKHAIWVIATLGFTDLIGIFLKRSIKRKRPILASNYEEGYSFPSGHVLGVTIMTLMLFKLYFHLMNIYLVAILIVLWLMVVVSRLSLKAHYPSDVIGATTLAICCFSISIQILAAF